MNIKASYKMTLRYIKYVFVAVLHLRRPLNVYLQVINYAWQDLFLLI